MSTEEFLSEKDSDGESGETRNTQSLTLAIYIVNPFLSKKKKKNLKNIGFHK